MKSFKLGRTKQCVGCPWRKAIDPNTIPEGFKPCTHQRMAAETEAQNARLGSATQLTIMQCHDSPDEKPQYCVGWVNNQLGHGNNIGLRIRMMDCENIGDLQVDGEQRQSFQEILTDALAMNPELEKPVLTKKCWACDGEGTNRYHIMERRRRPRTETMVCHICEGFKVLPVDETDAREDAEEARWEARNDR